MKRAVDETMDAHAYYEQPMVRRLREIFDHPQPPVRVTQEQFDGDQRELESLTKTPWHLLEDSSPWAYLMDLAYVDLQQDLFDYLFPGFLILWWEGQVSRRGGPEAEVDFYFALDLGRVLDRMFAAQRREAVLRWMVDAYIEGVDAWSGQLDVAYQKGGTNDLHGPLWSFNALGQSVLILPEIWGQLGRIETPGRAQWWLVLATGLVERANSCPFIPPWTPGQGGGGVYVLESAASIFDHGYLERNSEFVRKALDGACLRVKLEAAMRLFVNESEREWAADLLEKIRLDPKRVETRIARFLHLIGQPDLGGVLADLED